MAITKEFIRLKITELTPYENNPRRNDNAVEDVMQSIEQCGELDPIEIDENNVILSGHTRLKAYEQMGYDAVDCVRYTGLTDEQKRKYRLLANKTGEKALWDFNKLEIELDGLDFDGWDFGFEAANAIEFEDFDGVGDGGGSMMATGTKVRCVVGACMCDIQDPTHEVYALTKTLSPQTLAAFIEDALKKQKIK